MPAVAVEGIHKTYPSRFSRPIVALQPLDLKVEPGEIFGLLGPNGAGKTTLVKLLLGIVTPTGGEARLYDTSVRQPEARRRVGYLPENHRFPDFLTAGQVLDLYARLAGVPAEDRARRAEALLEKVRMSPWRDVKIRKFSKGMMQRLGLAQALMNDPDLIFLDEPTDGVDPVGRKEIKDLLLWLRGEGKTIFVNSHLLSEVEQVCSRVAILNKGKLVREGRISDLTSEERVYELATTPIPPDLLASVAGLQPLTSPPPSGPEALPRYRLAVSDRAHLNAVLDQLRTSGVLLEAVQPLRLSLEDYFIDVVTHGE